MNAKILIVDDEPDILDILESVLSDEGYQVKTAPGGREALELFGREPFDLVLTDIKMPDPDGFELVERVREQDEFVECVVMTGYATIENAVQVLRQDGAFDFITKPLSDLEKLLVTVRQALHKRSLRMENRKLMQKLERANLELERRVKVRTESLVRVNEALQKEMEERKAAVETLKDSERRYRLLAENMRDVVWTTDLDFIVTWVSPSVFSFLGFMPDQVLGKTPEELCEAESAVLFRKRAGELLSNPDGGHLNLEMRMLTSRGEAVWTEVVWSLFSDARGRPLGYLASSRDITERKRAEAEILDARAQLERRVEERTRELQDTRLEIIQHLGKAAEFKDEETGYHIIRMSQMCRLLGERVGLPSDECELLLNASPMHDIGKIGIPDFILQKPGKLDPHEWEVMKTHAIIGAELLAGNSSPLIVMARQIALTHHERWDGSGYPQGLAGKDIPLVGRICSVCDVFDALTSKRPYKEAWPVEKAVEEIRRCSGTQFDTELVAAFEDVLPEVVEILNAYRDE